MEMYKFCDNGEVFELWWDGMWFIGNLNGRTKLQFIEDIQELGCQ